MNQLSGSIGLIVFLSMNFAYANECSFEKTVQPLCEKIEAGEKSGEKIKFGDSILPSKKDLDNQATDFEARTKKLTKEEKEKFTRVFKKSQDLLEKMFLNDRAESELSKEELNMVQRIRNMKLSDLENKDNQSTCLEQGYFGFSPSTNSIMICPILGGYSEASLINATTTFMSRGLGSCLSAFPKNITKADPVSPEKHPFDLRCDLRGCTPGGLRTCLIEGSEGRVRAPLAKPDFETSYAKEKIESLSKAMKLEPSEIPAKVESDVKRFPGCYPMFSGDQADSAVSYWMGAEALAKHLENDPAAKNSEEPFAPIALWIDDACRFNKRKDIAGMNGHPSHAARFNDVMLKSAAFRKAFGCTKPVTAKSDCALSVGKTPAKPQGAAGASSDRPTEN